MVSHRCRRRLQQKSINLSDCGLPVFCFVFCPHGVFLPQLLAAFFASGKGGSFRMSASKFASDAAKIQMIFIILDFFFLIELLIFEPKFQPILKLLKSCQITLFPQVSITSQICNRGGTHIFHNSVFCLPLAPPRWLGIEVFRWDAVCAGGLSRSTESQLRGLTQF